VGGRYTEYAVLYSYCWKDSDRRTELIKDKPARLPFLLLLWCYNSGRALAFSTIPFHLRQSWPCPVHFIIFIFFRSFLTSSSHRDMGLPTGLSVNGFHLYIDCHVVHHKYHATSSKALSNLSFFIVHSLVLSLLYKFVLYTFIFSLSNLFYFSLPMCFLPS
jgi:hypothetical protein